MLVAQRDSLDLKLLLQSMKMKANVPFHDTHWKCYIHCIYFALNGREHLGTGLKDNRISIDNFSFSLFLWTSLEESKICLKRLGLRNIST